MNIYSGPILIVAIIVLIPTILIFLKNHRSTLNISYALLGISIFIWLLGDALLISAANDEIAILLTRIGYTGVIFIPTTAYHFFNELLNLKEKKFVIMAYFVSFIFLYLCHFTSYFSNNVNHYPWGYYPKANILQATCNIVYVLIFTRSLIALVMSVRNKSKLPLLQYQRNKYVLWASCIAVLGGLNYIPIYGINIYPFGYLFMLGFLSLIGYAIFKYRLMDISIAITRTSIFVIVYSSILGIPFWLAYTFQNRFKALWGDNWWIAPLVLLTFLAMLVPFIYLYIQRRAEDRLLSEQRRYQQTLRRASMGMTRIRDLKKLLDLTVRIVVRTVRLKRAAIYLLDGKSNQYFVRAIRGTGNIRANFTLDSSSAIIWHLLMQKESLVYEEVKQRMQDYKDDKLGALEKEMRDLNAALVVPAFVENKLLGFLVLGEKISGKLYSQDDLAVFSVLANQAALAIENAQFFGEIKETHLQLFQAEKMATIGTMANGLSHQINNRLNALGLISDDTLDTLKLSVKDDHPQDVKELLGKIKYALERISENVKQSGDVVRGLLKYSRPAQEGFEPLSLNQILDASLEMAQYKVRLDQFDLVRNYSPSTPKIQGNLSQLQEVFFNFIDNAYDAIMERKTTLQEENYRGQIKVSAEDEDGFLKISIEDNGMGAKREDLVKLFTPFFTTKVSSRKGTGLGLYVAQKIITVNHKGRIAVDSQYKKGTKFVIELPIAH